MLVHRTAIAIRVKGTNEWLGCNIGEDGFPSEASRLIEDATDEQKDKLADEATARRWVAGIVDSLRKKGKELEFVEITYTTPS